jgi:predicted GIY-YIG superfamily endonuclease
MARHATGAPGGHTSRRLPSILVWSDRSLTRDEAFAAERKLKGWGRTKKEALIAGDWDLICQLARNRQGST